LASGDLIKTPEALRQRFNYDIQGNYRVLKTSIDLPKGWRIEVPNVVSLLAALETIYPTLWIDVVQHQSDTLPLQPLEQVAERQTGLYRRVRELSGDLSEHLPRIVSAHCGLCVRGATWFDGSMGDASLPCPEACQPFMR